jgi:hypothetical protein
MKTAFLYFTVFVCLAACQSPGAASEGQAGEAALQPALYGQTVATADQATPALQVPRLLQEQDSVYTTLKGTALTSCTKKGCWMTLDLGQGESMRVTFRDYGFFVPKDLQGEQVVVEGILSRKISSPDEQRHYAEDAGKSPEEVAAIQEADTVYAFEAVGVLIYPASQN